MTQITLTAFGAISWPGVPGSQHLVKIDAATGVAVNSIGAFGPDFEFNNNGAYRDGIDFLGTDGLGAWNGLTFTYPYGDISTHVGECNAVLVDPATGLLWASGGDDLWSVDSTGHAVNYPLTANPAPTVTALLGTTLYWAGSAAGATHIGIWDVSSHTAGGSITAGSPITHAPLMLAALGDGTFLYIESVATGTAVHHLDATGAVLGTRTLLTTDVHWQTSLMDPTNTDLWIIGIRQSDSTTVLLSVPATGTAAIDSTTDAVWSQAVSGEIDGAWLSDTQLSTGYCVTTVQDLSTQPNWSTWNSNLTLLQGNVAVSADGAYLYALDIGGGAIMRADLSSGVLQPAWVTFPSAPGLERGFIAVGPDGTIYVLAGRNLGRVDATGSILNDPGGASWTSLPHPFDYGPRFQSSCAAFGRDGKLYITVLNDPGWPGAPANWFPTVLSLDVGTVTFTHIAALDAADLVNNTFPFTPYGGVAVTSTGVVWVNLAQTPPSSPFYRVDSVLRRYDPGTGLVTDIAIQAEVGGASSFSQAFGGIFCDASDHLIVPMVTGLTTPDLSWFLRVAPDGTATRIAGTWSSGAAPGPPVTATNIVDGPLGTSLCCEVDDGAGITQDGRTVWFIDDGNQSGGVTGNLLRKLALCPASMRWRTGAVVIC